MKKLKINHKVLGVAATLGLSLVAVANVSAWGPERETFTMKNPATYPTFNSITDNPSIGDERDFVRVGEINADVTQLKNEVEVVPGRQYIVSIYFHNNASSTFNNAAHNYSGVAIGTRMSSTFSTYLTSGERGAIAATIKANNSKPGSVWDEAYMTTKSDRVVMRYVTGSAKIHNNWKTSNTTLPSTLFTEGGAYLGLNALNGVIPGCEEYHGVVRYVLQAEELGGTITKSVSKDGTNFGESVTLAPNEEATYKLTIRNTGDMALTNATVKDVLPAGLTLVSGSVQLSANESTTPEPLSDNIFGTGYNLGTIGTGNTVYITYRVKAGPDFDCNGTELTNKATLTYDTNKSSGETKEASTTITVKRTDGCDEPEPTPDTCETNPALPECQEENCQTNPDLPGCQNPDQNCKTNPDMEGCQELPNTGPLEIILAIIIVLGIGGGGYYFYRTKKTLKAVKDNVSGKDANKPADKEEPKKEDPAKEQKVDTTDKK
ncbi:DUF11 domain-containing protein [Candidatus Saccharibacteria bacterium]|nr:DUF11 domain-containing protein [Candidatus Saccharibacteria bacterium]